MNRLLQGNAPGHVVLFGGPGVPGVVPADRTFAEEDWLPAYARTAFEILNWRFMELTEEIGALDQKFRAWHAENEASRRLAAIPVRSENVLGK